MAKRDRNRFRKTYPYLRRKPVFETVMSAGSNVDIIQVGVISYNETHTGSHTFATAFYTRTNDLRALQKLLGHSSITTTQIYEHSSTDDRLGFMDDFQAEIDKLFQKGSH